MTGVTADVKAEAYVKNTWKVPMSDGSDYLVRAGWDPGKVATDEIAVVAEVERSRQTGAAPREVRAVGAPVLQPRV